MFLVAVLFGCSELSQYGANLGLPSGVTRANPNAELVGFSRKKTTVACCACQTEAKGTNVVWPYSGPENCEYQATGGRFKSCAQIQSLDRNCSLARMEPGDWLTRPVCTQKMIAFQKPDESVGQVSPTALPGDCEFESAPYAAPIGGIEEQTRERVPGAAPLSVCACVGGGGTCRLVRWVGAAQELVAQGPVEGNSCDFNACQMAFAAKMKADCPLFNPGVAKLYSRG